MHRGVCMHCVALELTMRKMHHIQSAMCDTRSHEDESSKSRWGRQAGSRREWKTNRAKVDKENEDRWVRVANCCVLSLTYFLLFFLPLLLFGPFSVIPFHMAQGTNKGNKTGEWQPPLLESSNLSSRFVLQSWAGSSFSLSQPWRANHAVSFSFHC